MPPAFILSQNQTLKFNCLKSLLFQATTALTLLSLCWLAFKVTCVYFKYFEKINGNYLSICIVSNKISFLSYSIFNLLFPGNSLVLRQSLDGSLSIITQLLIACQAFFETFLKNFHFFWNFEKFLASHRTACIIYHFLFWMSNIFLTNFKKLFGFFKKNQKNRKVLFFYANFLVLNNRNHCFFAV